MTSTTEADDKASELFRRYIAKQRIVIADASITSRTNIANLLIFMGASAQNIELCPDYSSAVTAINTHHPTLVIADYDLGKRCGLELLQNQRANHPETRKTLFMLVTSNTSQTAVARAAEEDVDTFVLKPFRREVLRNLILKAALLKIHPSEYQKTLEKGRAELAAGQLDEAHKTFELARSLDPKAATAHFYLGQIEELKKSLTSAFGHYQSGLAQNKIHYKCLVGVFDILMAQKQYREAYDVVKRITHYFPANPQRITQVLRLAIQTHSYDDIERYYQIFTAMDERTPEVVRYVGAALIVCGKYYLNQGVRSRAMELFNRATLMTGGNPKQFREMITALLDANFVNEAEQILAKIPAANHGSPDFKALAFAVHSKSLPTAKTVDLGRKLLAEGIHDPIAYTYLIRASLKAGLKDAANDLIREALQRWPELKSEFNSEAEAA